MAEAALQRANTASMDEAAKIIERVVLEDDLSALTPSQRVEYYRRVCESLGLNPLTRPFGYIRLNGKLVLYAKKDCTEQLRRRDGISIEIVSRQLIGELGIYEVVARATTKDGRQDEAIGAVSVRGLQGDALANAIMKCETKAKRRATLSICGLGWLDETEIDTVPDARRVDVDMETGEIKHEEPATSNGNGKTDLPRLRPAPADGKKNGAANGRARLQNGEPATVEQARRLEELRNLLGWSKEDLRVQAQQRYGVSSARELTREQAADLIRFLEDYLFNADDIPFDDSGGADPDELEDAHKREVINAMLNAMVDEQQAGQGGEAA